MSSPNQINQINQVNQVNSTSKSFKNPHDKKGRSTSCLLCQKRKQKCDHRLPSCTTCIKAGVKCIQPAKYNVQSPQKDEYTIMLEKKIKFLEKVLDSNQIKIDDDKNKKNFKYKKLSPFLSNDNETSTNTSSNTNTNTNTTAASTIQSIICLTPEPTSIPHDRKLPIPTSVSSNDPISINLIKNKKSYVSIDSIDYSNSLFAKYNLKEFLNFDPVFEFDENLSRAFLDIHFSRLQFKYPLLDEDEIYEFHNCYVSNQLQGYMNNNDQFHYCCCRMWMIFAISSCLHMTTGKYQGPPPARYFSTAIRHITKVKNIGILEKIEILTLAVLYLIRTDRDSVCLYEIIKDSLKLCIDLKLHKFESYQNITPQEKFKKLRLWWCVYLLERMISIAVGKNYNLKEDEVDLNIPLFENMSGSMNQSKHQQNSNFINQSIKLRRIESRFVEFFQITSTGSINVSSNQLPLVEKYFQELEIWRSNCQGFSNGIENETLRLYYYRSVRLLIQPFLELMNPMDKLFRECQAAAGQICQLFKVFHEKTVFGHSTTAIHTVFVAGVTLVYCLWLARNKDDQKRKALGDVSKHTRPTVSESLFNGLNDLRACSICLYVMTERSKFALIFRDTFDQLMTATITNLIERCGPDSSELIYDPLRPGMPPAVVRRDFNQDLNFGTKRSSGNGMERSQFLGKSSPTEEEKFEQEERKRKQGQLQKNVVPKSLSHLLINSNQDDQQSTQGSNVTISASPVPNVPSLITSSSPRSDISSSLVFNHKRPKLDHNNSTNPLESVNFSNLSYSYKDDYQESPSNLSTTSSTHPSMTSSASSTTTSATSNYNYPPELSLFNNRTNTMINNISVWTGESGGPPINTASLFDFNNNKNSRSLLTKNSQSNQNNNSNGNNGINVNGQVVNGLNNKNLGETYLWNVPVEEFWTNNDDYGFLA
ncbi:putative transcriptional regulatory protein [Wickerhamomyces ciferrii]|uniref:Transcriptional regulatory protein n=1 Tax=Wickerhamomyces ciferrii (strain ATCC 14091 / BCRC 22168 / CBS 111 / JCM 3599 / NBRC 0793 / NRRL Y-1031 F-60-10) TaxID=1206466 RepID=K0KHV6_WICCF|nr:putative transcriptional regulatory protein [Wickerhamomyces ciferrii]CCH41752.1 putative transcriptional regulatory protein [Wickerhamomyces ciferrii]